MKTEKVILSFIAILIGLLVTGIIFFLYQTTKIVPQKDIRGISFNPSPTPSSSLYLSLDTPQDEEVVDRKVVKVTGKTIPQSTVIVSTNSADEVITPSATGTFATTVTIDDGENEIQVFAISPNGEEAQVTRTVTYSTETF